MSISELLEQDLQETTIPESYHEEDPADLEERVWSIKKRFGDKLYMPGHHYQKDEVMQFADDRGDSLKLAQISASNKDAEYIVFCGVHFMAETADSLEAGGWEIIKKYVEMGMGISIVSGICLTPHDRLVSHKLDRYFPGRTYGVVMRRGKFLSPQAKRFIEFIDPNFFIPKTGMTRTG
jgi:DNA-binding transcriptional LysR family regulator